MRYSSLLLTSAATIGLLAPALAHAQAVTSPPTAQEAIGLEEIVVTAQKREQNLQSVPVAVSAVTGEALQAKNVTQFTDLTSVAPSLTVTQSGDVTTSSINLRGIGTFAFSTSVEPSVAVIVDDLAVLQQGQAFAGLSDIERVEILRGPQGTLFGKGASAGAINITTRAPSYTLTGRLAATVTTDDQRRVEAGVSGPLGERLGFRLNGFYDDRDGYIRNLTNGHKLAGETSWGVRGRLSAELSDTVKLSVLALHNEIESNGIPGTYRVLPAGALGFRTPPFAPGSPLAPSAVGLTPGNGNYKIRLNVDPYTIQKQSTASARATADLGPINLVSITGYQDWKYDFLADVDNTDIPFLGPNGVVQGGPTHSKLFSQELRAISDISGPLQYLFGVYYADGETTRNFSRTPAGPLRSETRAANGTRTYAAFAQGTYDIGQTTHLDAGLRFNREKIDVRFQRLVASGTLGCLTAACTGKSADDAVTYKLALRQDFTSTVMGYASYATGYKGQAYDVSSSFSQVTADVPVRAETSKAYELGLKSRFLENRVQLNVAAFLTDYDDFQAQSAVVQPDGSVLFKLNNVGKLRTKGVEVDLLAKPARALTLGFSAAYIDAKIRAFPFANCYTNQTAAQGCFDIDGAGPGTATAQNLAGKPLANSPKFKYTLSGSYDLELPSLPYDGFVSLDWRHQSKVGFDLGQNPNYVYGGYGVLNGSVGIKQDGGQGYRVTLFANNLLDKHFVGTLNSQAGSTTQPAGVGIAVNQVLTRDSRRYVGLRVSYDF